MIYSPSTFPLLLVLLVLLALLILLVEMRVLTYAYRKVGVNPRYAFAVMVLSLLGSHVNIPLYAVSTRAVAPPHGALMFDRTYVASGTIEPGMTVVALNLGGALIPILVSLYLLLKTRMYGRMLIGTAVVAAIVHSLAQIVPGMGIAVPMLVPPLVAAGVALLLAFRRAPPVAYVSGSMGTLIGADLLNLGQIERLGAPVISIGGAGTFDGVFLTGILAGLLA